MRPRRPQMQTAKDCTATMPSSFESASLRLKALRSGLEELEQSLLCGICLESLRGPVRAKCGHVFCRLCLHRAIEAAMEAKATGESISSSRCPECNWPNVTKRSLADDTETERMLSAVAALKRAIKEEAGDVIDFGNVDLKTPQKTPSPEKKVISKSPVKKAGDGGGRGRAGIKTLRVEVEKMDEKITKAATEDTTTKTIPQRRETMQESSSPSSSTTTTKPKSDSKAARKATGARASSTTTRRNVFFHLKGKVKEDCAKKNVVFVQLGLLAAKRKGESISSPQRKAKMSPKQPYPDLTDLVTKKRRSSEFRGGRGGGDAGGGSLLGGEDSSQSVYPQTTAESAKEPPPPPPPTSKSSTGKRKRRVSKEKMVSAALKKSQEEEDASQQQQKRRKRRGSGGGSGKINAIPVSRQMTPSDVEASANAVIKSSSAEMEEPELDEEPTKISKLPAKSVTSKKKCTAATRKVSEGDKSRETLREEGQLQSKRRRISRAFSESSESVVASLPASPFASPASSQKSLPPQPPLEDLVHHEDASDDVVAVASRGASSVFSYLPQKRALAAIENVARASFLRGGQKASPSKQSAGEEANTVVEEENDDLPDIIPASADMNSSPPAATRRGRPQQHVRKGKKTRGEKEEKGPEDTTSLMGRRRSAASNPSSGFTGDDDSEHDRTPTEQIRGRLKELLAHMVDVEERRDDKLSESLLGLSQRDNNVIGGSSSVATKATPTKSDDDSDDDIFCNTPQADPQKRKRVSGKRSAQPQSQAETATDSVAAATGVDSSKVRKKLELPSLPPPQPASSPRKRSSAAAAYAREDARATLKHSAFRSFVVLSTGLGPADKELFDKFVDFVGCQKRVGLDDAVTHVVVEHDQQLRAERTLKYLQAVALGKRLIGVKWIRECIKAQVLLSPDPYEVLDNSGDNGPERARMVRERGAPKLFEDFEFCLQGSFKSVRTEQMKQLLKWCGAAVVRTPSLFSFDSGVSRLLVVDSAGDTAHDPSACLAMFMRHDAAVVDKDWVIESLGAYKVLSIRHFLTHEASDDELRNNGCAHRGLLADED